MGAKWAWVFPGQGSQVPGMGAKLFADFPEAKVVFEAADDALGEKLSLLCFEGPKETLELTANAQPAILTVSAAAHAVFSRRSPAAAFVAGHSLGEYSALAAVGALALTDAVRSVRARGLFMQEAVPKGVGAMAAVLGLDAEKIRSICDELRAAHAGSGAEVVQPANYNSPEQTVIAGHAAAVARAEEKLKAAGAKRVVPLAVSAPFHSALMEPVKARLKAVLERLAVKAPAVPVVTNVEAKPNADAARVIPLLLEQVTAPVRWVECVQELERQGVTHLVELGPGKVLSGLVKRISKTLKIVNVEDGASLEVALKELSAA